MISLIMPAKNSSKFIEEAIESVVRSTHKDWELIIVNDHSTDNTEELVRTRLKDDQRIKLINNPGKGKVQALNFGFEESQGDIIKCIDSDDLITENCLEIIAKDEVVCHDASVVDQEVNLLGIYRVNTAIIHKDYDTVLSHLIGIPRWSWSMPREIATKVFPMPLELPFEDVWFSIMIKQYADKMTHIRAPLYSYRQHDNQTFGGILNYEKSILNFRANRMLNLIKVLESIPDRVGMANKSMMDFGKVYYGLLASRFSLKEILLAPLQLQFKVKLILLCFAPSMAVIATKIKWALDKR